VARAVEGDDAPNAADAALELDDLRVTVWRALSTAPPRCREVFWLVWGEQRSYTDVAHMLGIAVPTVRNQMSRALKRLSQTLGVGQGTD
jgi:RNA polymerase sigma-70 factor (ECF subfamily)